MTRIDLVNSPQRIALAGNGQGDPALSSARLDARVWCRHCSVRLCCGECAAWTSPLVRINVLAMLVE
jgi:hypothetical protein